MKEIRMTRQGIRDLNHYGPRQPPAAPIAPKAVEESTTVPAPLPVTQPVVPGPAEE